MRIYLFIFLSFVMVMLGMIACHSTKKIQVYRFIPSVDCESCSFLELMEKLTEINSEPKSIMLKNDSILEYWKRYGGLGSLTTVKYYFKNNLIIIDSLDVYGEICPEEITNAKIIYSTDSLINSKTREKYYNQKYLDRINKTIVRSKHK